RISRPGRPWPPPSPPRWRRRHPPRRRRRRRRRNRLRSASSSGAPAQEILFGLADDPSDRKAEDGEYGDARDELVCCEQRSGHQDIGTDAVLGTDHFGGDEEHDRDRRRDAEAGEDRRQRARYDDLAHDRQPRKPE